MLDFHPIAEKFPRITGPAWELFKESILATGGNEEPVRYRVVGGTKQGLDGRNRYCACQDLRLPCKMEEVEVTDEDVEDWIIRRNFYRRHLDPADRAAVVAVLHKDGKSYRNIAKLLGISYGTVRNDVKRSGEQGCSPEPPPRVTGLDGKSYPASPAILCRPCRVGSPKPNCPECKSLRDQYGTPATNGRPFHKPVDPPLIGKREPGDDTEVVEQDERSAKERLWKKFNNWCLWLAYIKHAPEVMLEAFPGAIPQTAILGFQRTIDEELATLKKWKKSLEQKATERKAEA